MAVYFSGTATKQTYQVGKEYVNSRGQKLTANADGSFGNRDTGQVMRGSSYNPTVAWYADGADAATWGAYHNRPTAAAFKTDDGKSVYTRPDPARYSDSMSAAVAPVSRQVADVIAPVASVRIAAPVVSMGNRGAFLSDNAWSGKDDPVQDLRLGGFRWAANPKTINAEMVEVRYGDNELVSTVFGVAAIGSDLGYNARRLAEANGFDSGRGVTAAINRAVEPNALGDALNSAHKGLTSWVNNAVADEDRRKQIEDDANDVIDYKLYLNGIEGQKAGDFGAVPNISDIWK